jgi:hypothetical protein
VIERVKKLGTLRQSKQGSSWHYPPRRTGLNRWLDRILVLHIMSLSSPVGLSSRIGPERKEMSSFLIYLLHGLMGMPPSADQFEYFCGGSGPLADGICIGPNITHFLPRPDLRVRLRQLFLCGRDKYVQPKLATSSLVFVAVA